MKLTFEVVEGGFVEGGYRYNLRCTPDNKGQNGRNQGNILIHSDVQIASFGPGAKVTIEVPGTADAK